MSVQACWLYLAFAFYLGYFAETLPHKANMIVWSISLTIAVFPLGELIYEHLRWLLRL